MPLYIRDDGVKGLARRAAEARRTTMTEAVREALERLLAQTDREREARDRALDELPRDFAANPPDRVYSDTEMYDENGLPRCGSSSTRRPCLPFAWPSPKRPPSTRYAAVQQHISQWAPMPSS